VTHVISHTARRLCLLTARAEMRKARRFRQQGLQALAQIAYHDAMHNYMAARTLKHLEKTWSAAHTATAPDP
jgi:cytidylate kinase